MQVVDEVKRICLPVKKYIVFPKGFFFIKFVFLKKYKLLSFILAIIIKI